MAVADGEFCQAEQDLLKEIAKRNNVSESQLKEIRHDLNKVDFEAPTDSREKFHQLYDLVCMMAADKKIHKDELKLCDYLVVKFGYSREKARDIIDAVRMNIENGNGYDETMKRVNLLIS